MGATRHDGPTRRGGLAIARFDGLRLFGTTGVLAAFFCLAGVFLVLPALLALLYRR